MKGVIIIVNYKSDEYSIKFIDRFIEIFNEQIELIVVDNSDSVSLKNYIDNIHYKIRYYSTESNLGYFGAAKWVLNKIDYKQLDFVVIANNDVYIETTDFFLLLKDKLNNADVIAPSIVNASGEQQNPHRSHKLSKPLFIFWKLYYLNYYLARVLLFVVGIIRKVFKYNDSNIDELKDKVIYSPHGAFIIFSNTFFKKGGYVDDSFFLYGEEESIGIQCSNENMRVIYCPDLKILHYESRSIGSELSKIKYNYQKESFKILILRNN